MPHLSLYLLGSPHIEMDGSPVEADTRKAIALLVYLAISGESHTRDALATLLWPDYDQSNARAALRRTLSALRKGLRQEALEVRWDSIGLLPGLDHWSDVTEFRGLLAASAAHGHPPGEACGDCLPLLSKAVNLYRGDFMAGFTLRDSPNFDEWQFFEADELRRELAGALEKLARGDLQAGDFELAIAAARRWSSLDPLSEEAHRMLMQCYAGSGQRNAALRQYRECVRILEKELGVPPLEETTALYRSILERVGVAAGREAAEARETAGRKAGTPEAEPDERSASPNIHRPGGLPLVGRARQMAALAQAYAGTGSNGYFMVLEGELGVGKTRLAEEFLADARGRGAAVVRARCYEGETHLAYAPFIEGMSAALAQPERAARLKGMPEHWRREAARLLPELAGAAAPPPVASLENPGAQSRFFEGLRQALIKLCRGYVPGVLFLDDLHWVDAASLDLLTYLVRRLQGSGLFILATWRGESIPAGHRLNQLLADAERAGAGSALPLRRLNQSEVSELVRSVALPEAPPEFGERLYHETEGLPFFLVEYLENLNPAAAPASGPASQDWSIPHNVRDLLRARLASAGETGWQLLTTAAVIGRSFDYNTLREASGRSEVETVAGLEALLAQGLVKEQAAGSEAAGERGSEISYDFSHDKLRALVLEETSRTRQRLLHLRVAEALAGQLHHPREGWARAGQIARHYHLSDQDPLAAEYFKLAGEHAQSVYANVDAMAFFQEALAAGHPQAAKLHEDIGDLHILAGEYSAALNRYQTASALAEAQALPGLEHKLGMVHHRRGELDLAVSYFQSALEALGESGEAGPRARLYADWSRTSHRQGQPQQAWELAGRAVELAEQAEDAAAQGQAHNILGILARNAQDWDQACAHLERSLSVARASGDMGMQAAALNNLALVYGDRGEPEQAIQFAQTALELCARQGDRHREAALHNNLADLYHAAGQAEQAMSHLKKAVVIFAEIGGEAGQMQSETWMLTEW